MARRPSSTASTRKALQAAVNKHFGPGTVIVASDPSLAIAKIPTGVLSIDWLLGGGFARNRHTELYGNPNLGKTYLAYRAIASAQSQGLVCAFCDVENKFDPQFAASAGVQLDELELTHQQNGHRVMDLMIAWLGSGLYDLIVLDSIASLLPQQEQQVDMQTVSFGTYQARLMSSALRQLTTVNKNTACLYINQVRENIGVTFGKKSVTSGGRAMGHYAASRLEFVRTETLKKKIKQVGINGESSAVEVPSGHRVLVRVEKDQTGSARQGDTATFVFDYDLGGIDPVEDLMFLGLHMGLVHKSGTSWWVAGYEEEKQTSRSKFKSWLRRSRAVAQDLEEMVLDHDPGTVAAAAEEAGE